MIDFRNIKETAIKAYENGEIFQFLLGYNGYDLRVIDVPVDVPTDWTRIIPYGIYAIYEEMLDEKVKEAYEQAIRKAIKGTPKELWCAVNILYFQIDHEKMGKSPFMIDKEIVSGLTQTIINARAALEKELPYGKNGWNMYEDIMRLNSNFEDDWGMSFLSC